MSQTRSFEDRFGRFHRSGHRKLPGATCGMPLAAQSFIREATFLGGGSMESLVFVSGLRSAVRMIAVALVVSLAASAAHAQNFSDMKPCLFGGSTYPRIPVIYRWKRCRDAVGKGARPVRKSLPAISFSSLCSIVEVSGRKCSKGSLCKSSWQPFKLKNFNRNLNLVLTKHELRRIACRTGRVANS